MTLDDDADLRARAQRMLDHSEIANIRVIQLSAERLTDVAPDSVNVTSQTSYIATDETFANRFEWQADLRDVDNETVAELKATIVVEFEIAEAFEPDQDAAEAIAQSTGYFAAYPYVRELFQSACIRLQLNPLVLGMLLHGSTHPRRISMP